MKKRFNINLDDTAFTRERTPPKPQFQSLFKSGQSASSSSSSSGNPAPEPADKPLSYADYIVQSKRDVAAPSREPRAEGADAPLKLKELEPGGCAKVTESRPVKETQEAGTDQKEGNQPGSDPGLSTGPKPVGSGSSIIVSPRQRGNPILKFVRSVPWEFGEVVPDYVLGLTTCALFLSLRYHNLNPNYIHERLKQLGQTYTLRVLLVQVDVKDPHHALKELARICVMADCTLILAWSPEEAGRYLETYKSYEKKPADLLKEQVEKDYLSKVTDCLTTVKSVNKTDAITLLSTFSSVDRIISASKEDLVLCPGLGPQKARRLYDVLHKPFLKSKTKDG
ncbi:DNA excision repair protein ERCC-1 [Cheilinus undulatus]|uniref:DNA excision repair protein ERCC-1 n=1 Tax=Cheilinus undulatus TaxID=241271 RepID=UPI001BD5A260|nr:DNA excision repair protein ERCC-1 [Cheilinus undulatus]